MKCSYENIKNSFFFPYDPSLFLSDGRTSFGFYIMIFLCFDIFFLAYEAIINNSNILWNKIKQNYIFKMNNNFFK